MYLKYQELTLPVSYAYELLARHIFKQLKYKSDKAKFVCGLFFYVSLSYGLSVSS